MGEQIGPPDTEQLPQLYQRWIAEMLPGGIPREQVATCMECAMCPAPGEEPDAVLEQFNPAAKCCTYFPNLPNFLVGAALDEDSAGAGALRAFVAGAGGTKADVDLYGVSANEKYRAIFGSLSAKLFGRDGDLLCPYAIEAESDAGPLCGIWQHRNAVCSTYFCKHVRGHTGNQFWVALRNLFLSVEYALAWWCIGELVVDVGRALEPGKGGQSSELALHGRAWEVWPGTPEEFYRACATKVAGLSWAEVRGIAGIKTRTHERSVGFRYGNLVSRDVPARLRAKAIRLVRTGGDRTTLQGDPPGEIFQLPSVVVQLLPYFDGRSTSEILAEIKQVHQIEIDAGLVRRLCDFGVLESAVPGEHGP